MPPSKNEPIPVSQVLAEEFEALHGSLPNDLPTNTEWKDSEDLPKVIDSIHAKEHAALCLSGGGIRSATFALGILQGLARHNLLDKFHYLSTVSGGGYMGGWLSARIHRKSKGLQGVIDELSKQSESQLEPESKSINHLRNYSNYLSPKLGLLSADTWTLVATYVRNLLLNWFVFIPLLLAVLLIPRVCVAIIRQINTTDEYYSFLKDYTPYAAFVMGAIAISYISLNLPSVGWKKSLSQKWFLIGFMVPLGIFISLLSMYCGLFRELNQINFMYFAISLNLLGSILYLAARSFNFLRGRTPEQRNKRNVQHIGWFIASSAIFLIITVTIGAIFGYGGAGVLNWSLERLYASPYFISSIFGLQDVDATRATFVCFGGLLFLVLFGLGGTLIVGSTSYITQDEDREWWARAAAWILITFIVWSAISPLVLFGPLLLLTAKLSVIKKGVIALSGIISGLTSVLGGFSSGSPSGEQKGGSKNSMMGILTKAAAPAFVAFLVLLFSLGENLFLAYLSSPLNGLLEKFPERPSWMNTGITDPNIWTDHLKVLNDSSLFLIVVAFLLLAGTGGLIALIIKVNKFSLHAVYRNRLIRAYLGATRIDSGHPKDSRNPDLFTGFDPADNLKMHELLEKNPEEPNGRRLLHIVNIALNLVSGEKLAWQQRKAETFTASPLHCGNFQLGYRSSKEYGDGISLGTAVAISGAAASPNMGYHSSPVITFLMALFNLRLGWWLGNPGRAGERQFHLSAPRFSIGPLIQEALGQTDDKNPYVYLSDGGHFENLGLYEMVLRRCNLIIVSDASCDSDYAFEDLGNAIRKIRIDFGIPIEIHKMSVCPKPEGKYCAIGRIRYSCVDKGPNVQDGILIYIKPVVCESEPADVRNYARNNNSFPHESTADQFFSESQFESYRILGSHIIDQICAEVPEIDKLDGTHPVDIVCNYLYSETDPPEWLQEWRKSRSRVQGEVIGI